MEVVQSSVLGRLLLPVWLWLRARYEYSLLARVLRGIAQAWSRACAGSVLIQFVTREGCLSKAWKDSGLCRILTFLLSIPTILLQKLYGACREAFENSVAARIVFAVVEETPLAVAWLMLVIMVIPFKYWNNAYSFAGFLLCFLLAVASGMRKRNFRLDLAFLGPWIVAFGAMILVAWPLSAYPSLSTRFLLYYVTCMLCVVVIVSTVETWRHLTRLMAFSSLALLVMSLAGLYQRIQGVEVNPSYVDMNLNKGMPGRVWSFYENPNTFAEVLLLLIPVAIAYMLCSKGWLGRFLGFFSAAVGCVAMAMTYSRASWVGLAFAAVVFVVLWNRKLIPFGILAALVVLAILPDTVFNRILTIFNTSDTSTNSRFPPVSGGGGVPAAAPRLGRRPGL
ncbi:MAG: O-antigen ligase family protein [Evtepia gabavorous]